MQVPADMPAAFQAAWNAHEVDTVILAVLTQRDTEWRIHALENVTVVDPRTGQPVLRPREE
jgi:hypothetical protein